MCSACGFPPAIGHWTDAGGATPHDRLRIRFSRIALLKKLLQPHSIFVHEMGPSHGVQISNGRGKTVICEDLDGVWKQFELFTGSAFDPLNL